MNTRSTIITSSVILVLALAGSADAAQSQVYSSSRQSCRVPNVLGRSEREARDLIQRADLSVGRIQSQPSSRAPAGRVIAQRPQPCGDANSDGVVDLILSSGPDHDSETPPRRRDGGPSIGTAATVAAAAAIGAAILASRNKKKPEETPAPVAPTPPAATPAPPPRVVNRTATVPPVVGLSLAEARTTVSAAQLRTVMTNVDEAQQPGASVVTQVPAAGTMVVPGASVALTFTVPAVPVAPDPAPPVRNAIPVEPTPQPVRPSQPVTRPVQPPVPRPVAPLLPSTPLVNLIATPVAIQPLAPIEPTDDSEPVIPWRWIVLALALIAAMGAWPQRPSALPKRFAFVPRVDPGLQIITEGDRSSLAISVMLDAGIQEIKYHSSQDAIGA
jgi:hypothetical protein